MDCQSVKTLKEACSLQGRRHRVTQPTVTRVLFTEASGLTQSLLVIVFHTVHINSVI